MFKSSRDAATVDCGASSAPTTQVAASDCASASAPQLKICVLAACPFPSNHGTPGSIRELTEAAASLGHEVHVVCYHMGEDLPLRNVHVHRIPDWTGERTIVVGPSRRRPLYNMQMVFKTISVMRRHRLDLMHAHGYEAALVAACCRPIVRRPILYSAHNRMGDELASYDAFRSQAAKKMASALAWALDRTVPRIGNRCVPHSENLKKFLDSRGLQKRSEPILNFGIDFERFPRGDRRQLRRELGIADEPVVLYSGVMDRFQRLDLLLGAMQQVVRTAPEARLVLLVNVPHDGHQRKIRAEAERLGIADRVSLLYPQSLDEGLKLLAIADVGVVPRPVAPGFPIKLLNYMAARLPAVMYASSASGVMDRRHVLLAHEDTADALADAILEVLEDDQLREEVAAGGNAFVRSRHDRRAASATLCDIYARMLQQTRRWKTISQRPPVVPASASAIDDRVFDQKSNEEVTVDALA